MYESGFEAILVSEGRGWRATHEKPRRPRGIKEVPKVAHQHFITQTEGPIIHIDEIKWILREELNDTDNERSTTNSLTSDFSCSAKRQRNHGRIERFFSSEREGS